MLIRVDEEGCITGYATLGGIEGGIEVPDTTLDGIPPEHRGGQYLRCYKWDGAQVTLDAAALSSITQDEQADEIRARREAECFSIIDRSRLWYEELTTEQLAELAAWRDAWLVAPETGEIPDRPAWIK